MKARLDQFEGDLTLLHGDRFADRIDAADQLEEFLMPGEAGSSAVEGQDEFRARQLLAALEHANAQVFDQVRRAIAGGDGAACLRQWRRRLEGDIRQAPGYGYMDALVAGVLDFDHGDAHGLPPGQDMVFYQPTPVALVMDMVDRLALAPADLLVDIGSGLGHVPLLANILSGAHCAGIEWQGALVAQARQAAMRLGLDDVSLVRGDARTATLPEATVYYLYTPFKAAVMDQVLARLRHVAARGRIRVATLGPCTAQVAGQAWLTTDDGLGDDEVVLFHSR